MRDVVTGRADFGFMPRNIRRNTNLIDVSNLVHNEDVVVGHYVNEFNKRSSMISFESFSIFAPSSWFFFEYVSMFIFAFLFAYLLGRYLRRPWQFPVRFFYSLFSPEYPAFSRCSAVGAFFLSVVVFLFFVQQMIGNNIKTEVSPHLGIELCEIQIIISNYFLTNLLNFSSQIQKVSTHLGCEIIV